MKEPIPFGKYSLLQRINVGGMAEIFRAKAFGVEGFERLIAVKRILPNIAEDEEFIKMFVDEAKIAVQLNHANIAQIFELGKVAESYFISLEYVHGKDLRAIFERCQGPDSEVTIPQACFLIMKICEGLDYCHNKRDAAGRDLNLVHRDVSPQNVIVSYEGEIKLVDFGIAKASGKGSKTQAGILKGKFGYMSPEQVRGLPLDRRSDIFSVGIVLYETLTGERLFQSESDFATLEKVRNVEILPPSTYNPRIGSELEQIVLRALAKDFDERYQNAIDLHDDLQAYMYTSGEFYSRKDLAAWMKRHFAREIEDEDRQIERERSLPAENPASAVQPIPLADAPEFLEYRQSDVAELPQPPTSDTMVQDTAPVQNMQWEDEEAETHIYDKPATSSPQLQVPANFLEVKVDKEVVVTPGETPQARPEVPLDPDSRDSERVPLSAGPLISTPTPATVSLPPATSARRYRFATYATMALIGLILGGGVFYYFAHFLKRPGTIQFPSLPTGARVFIDGKPQSNLGDPPTSPKLKPGFYMVAVHHAGDFPWEDTVEVEPGAIRSVKPQLKPVPRASVELRTRPSEGVVFLDGYKMNKKTPLRIDKILPGKHSLEVRLQDHRPWSHTFTVASKEVLKLSPELLPYKVKLTLTTTPIGVAQVYLEEAGVRTAVGASPIAIEVDSRKSYHLVVVRKGYEEWRQPVVFSDGKDVTMEAALLRPGRKPKVLVAANSTSSPEATPPTAPKTDTKQPVAVASASSAKTPDRTKRATSTTVPSRAKPARTKPPSKPVAKKTPPVPTTKTTPPPTKVAATGSAPVGGDGTLMVNSKPWTRILIDGRPTGLTTPQRKIKLSAGRHSVTLRNEKFKIDETFSVVIKSDKPTKLIKKFAAN